MTARVGTGVAILCFLFYAAHATTLVIVGKWPLMLWSCHLACLLCGVGILRRNARFVSIAFLLLLLGLPMWTWNVVGGPGSLIWSSVFTHVGGLVIATMAVRRLGFVPGSWWRAAGLMVLLWFVTRLIVPEGASVNFAYGYFLEWAKAMPYPVYLVQLLVDTTVILLMFEAGWRRLTVRRPD
jgi:hypothetical protein